MPILKGSVTFARYRVTHAGKPQADERRWLLKGLKSLAFEPLDKKSEDDRAAGFVELENRDSVDFPSSALFYGERALFSWRIDQLRIPASQLRDELDAWAKAFEQREGRKPARSEKTGMRAQLKHALRMKAVPVTRLHDVAWNLKTDELQLWSASRKVIDELVAALEGAFEVRLIPPTPSTLCGEVDGGQALKPTAELAVGSEEVVLGAA